MLKHYETPVLQEVMRLPEGCRRELLASLLLSNSADSWLYRQGIEILFCTERACMEELCCRARADGVPPLVYRAELISLSSDLLTAAAAILREKGITLSVSIKGAPCRASIFPRPLQFAIVSLLRAALQIPPCRALYAAVSLDRSQFLLTVTAERIPDDNADLRLCGQIAALHGGRLLRTGQTVGLHFCPQTEASADPRWYSPGVDGLLKDALSCVQIGLYSVSDAKISSGTSD